LLKYGFLGMLTGLIIGKCVESTFTEDKYIISAGRLLLVQIPTYLIILGIIIGSISLYFKIKNKKINN